jgi:hypothetical protein
VAVANKVQTLDGRWLSIDGRVLFKANVAASETYYTPRSSSTFTRPSRCGSPNGPAPTRRRGRSGRSSVSTPDSTSAGRPGRAHIEARRGELAIQFQHDHGRPPTPVEALHPAQQATLETRDAKHEPRSLAEQRATWLKEAAAVVGGAEAVASMVRTVLAPPAEATAIADARWVAQRS